MKSDMPNPASLIVQKYGGSSVGTPEKLKLAAARIAKASQAGDGIVAVVSAMADTTDDLIALAERVSTNRHERELDMLLTAGERISMALLSMALRDLGRDAISFTGSQAGIVTDENHTRARILEIKPIRIHEELAKGKIVIVAGFQGVSRTKEITTLGRGGSDTTAVALAGALQATRCEILTDVPGIFSTDPRLLERGAEEAVRYPVLPLSLMLELAECGAQVMHPPSIEIARDKGFPLYVGMAHSSDPKDGTMLVPDAQATHLKLPPVVGIASRRNAPSDKFGQTVASLSVVGPQIQQNEALHAQVITCLKDCGIAPLGLTSHSQSFTVWFSDQDVTQAVRRVHTALIRRV
jgi:aspartate kinase